MAQISEKEALLAAVVPREEKITLGGRAVTVRELAQAAEVSALADNEDMTLKLVVRSVYGADGALVFSDADIPALRAAGKMRMLPLVNAVRRVNGYDAEENEKN